VSYIDFLVYLLYNIIVISVEFMAENQYN